MITKHLLLLICIISFATSQAQLVIDKAKLDSLLEYLYVNDKASVSVAINQGGETIYEGSSAFKDMVDGELLRASVDARYRIGSITKTFTAALVMKAIEDDKLTLDTKLGDYYPAVINADKITIEHMLRHRSGINNFTDNGVYLSVVSMAQEQDKVKEMIATLPADFEPGEKFSYCNTGYILLGYILEDIYGVPYFDLVQRELIHPLGLTSFGWMGPVDLDANEVKSAVYAADGWTIMEAHTNPLVVTAAGAIVSSAADLAMFWHALFNGKVIEPSSVTHMMTYVDNYGFGLYPVPYGSEMGVCHNGGVDAFNSNASYWKSKDASVVVFVNGLNMGYNDILLGVLAIMNGDSYEFPTWEIIEIDPEILKSYEGTYSTASFPLDITVTSDRGKLYAQAAGQSAFELTAKSATDFEYQGAGIKMTFDKPGGFHFNQNGFELDFVRQE